MKRNLFVIFLILSCCYLYGQPTQDLYFDNGCNYDTDDHGGLVTVFQSTEKAERIVAEIVHAIPEYAGRAGSFQIRSASVKNARATVRNTTRYILYSTDFLANFEQASLTREAAYSLFAHEIGHHILGHDLSTTNNQLRREQELAADRYSGRVMARLGKTQQEALAGIQTLGNSGGTESHPNPQARKDKIDEGYREERANMLPSGTATAGNAPRIIVPSQPQNQPQQQPTQPVQPTTNALTYRKFNLPLDDRCFKTNRWNLLQTAKAEIDDEKIRINFQLPSDDRLRFLRICLLSRVKSISPEERMRGSINGTGANIRLVDGRGEIIWNYLQEGYSQPEVTQEDLLSVVVYDERDLPRYAAFGGWAGSSLTIAAGVGAIAYGFTEIGKAKNIYEVYEQERNPEAAIYISSGERREERYTRANDKYKEGQYWSWGGGLLTAVGAIWMYDKIRMNATVKRDICVLGRDMEWEPLLACNQSTELGLRLWF